MRIVSNAISYSIPPAGTAFTSWATFQWDLPVPLALIFVSLAWVYSLFLVVAAASQDQERTKDVLLARGIVESIDRREAKPCCVNGRLFHGAIGLRPCGQDDRTGRPSDSDQVNRFRGALAAVGGSDGREHIMHPLRK